VPSTSPSASSRPWLGCSRPVLVALSLSCSLRCTRLKPSARASGHGYLGPIWGLLALFLSESGAGLGGAARGRSDCGGRAAGAAAGQRVPRSGDELQTVLKTQLRVEGETVKQRDERELRVDAMKKPEVFARLCADDCGPLDELKTSVSLLRGQVAEIKAATQTKKAAKLLNTPTAAAAAAAAELDVPEPDTACQHCSRTDGEDTLLACPDCDNCWHMDCLVPADR
jgi:hypothetical protein